VFRSLYQAPGAVKRSGRGVANGIGGRLSIV